MFCKKTNNKGRQFGSAAAAMALAMLSQSALSCGQDDYMGTICMMANTFCPRGTLEANGQLLAIQQYTALFSLMGTTYGGDGRTSFALPDLRGRAPVGNGQGPGLSNILLGQQGGTEQVTLSQANMPSHTHSATLRGANVTGTGTAVAGSVLANVRGTYSTGSADTNMGATAITVGPSGGSQPFANRSPYLGVRYCVVSVGIFPPRN